MFDSLGAFVPGGNMTFEGAEKGPLKGFGFAVKDIFDLKGYVTGYGNPDWQSRRRPAKDHAEVVQKLLDAGAMVIGKTITDEFAYSLNGQNMHYGTPANSEAPGRIPGGSSSGSASAVAGGLVDFALGSDTGGSIRVPGSYCGLYGLRPTHDRINRTGVLPLSDSFDTVGWFARDAWLLHLVGEVLFEGKADADKKPEKLLVAVDAFDCLDLRSRGALKPHLERLEQRLGKADYITLNPDNLSVTSLYPAGEAPGGLAGLADIFRVIQGREIWCAYGEWMTRVKPRIAPDIQQRLDWVATITDEQLAEASEKRVLFVARLNSLLSDKALLCLPSAPGIAPRIKDEAEVLAIHRSKLLALTSAAGLGGCPQITLPLGTLEGCPLGLGLMGAKGSDLELLAFAESFCGEEEQQSLSQF
ncbi:amidase [Kiloniella laminariae]|uniref:amidase n=1 Tax=Kiloniella laminariae TaxID=454162 RepID=UPI000382EDCD|nr:amidase [Kiloniella laminariae]